MTEVPVRPGTLPARTTVALRHRGEQRDSAEIGSDLRSCMHRLAGLGIRGGDRVVLKGHNSPAYVLTFLALAHADISVVLVDHSLDIAGTSAIARLAAARWVLTDGVSYHSIKPGRHVYYPDLLADPQPRSGSSGLALDLAPWWRREDAAILCSSGTTGGPKCVVKSGRSLRDNTLRTIAALDLSPDEVLAPWLPFSHQYGLSVLLSWWLAGATLSVATETRPDRAATCAIADQATIVEATPSTYRTLLRLIAAKPRLRSQLAASVNSWGSGGEPLPRPVSEEFQRVMEAPLLDGYGLTEVGNVALATPGNPVGCGRPLPGTVVRVVDDSGRPVGPEQTGEIEVDTTDLMTGYLTADGLDRPAPGWYATGDLGHLDQAGNLHVVGRRHAVHRRGYTLSPESIERRAEQCGQPVLVLPVDDERRGCLLIFAVCDPSGGSPIHWRQRICTLLPRYEHPNRVYVLEEFPTTANGKIDRARLRAMLTEPR